MGDWISLTVFLATSALIMGVLLFLNRDRLRASARVRALMEAARADPAAGRFGVVLTWLRLAGASAWRASEADKARLRERFVGAGIYAPNAGSAFLSARLLLMCSGLVLGV